MLETARHAPMSMPYFYGIARRYLHEAREHLDPSGLTTTERHAEELAVESILDELQTRKT